MKLRQFDSLAPLASAAVDTLREAVDIRPSAVLGWPSGRSTLPVLQVLATMDIDWSGVTIAMMDDYAVEAGEGVQRVPGSAHYSCDRWVERELLPSFSPGHRPTVLVPDAVDPAGYDARLSDLGGIDVFVVGIGASDGHVAFNPPGSGLDTRTRIVALAESTRHDNLTTFPDFDSLDRVPTHGVTVGLATIRDARQVLAVAHGPGKADVVRRTVAAEGFDPALPSTFLHTHPAASLLVAELGVDL